MKIKRRRTTIAWSDEREWQAAVDAAERWGEKERRPRFGGGFLSAYCRELIRKALLAEGRDFRGNPLPDRKPCSTCEEAGVLSDGQECPDCEGLGER